MDPQEILKLIGMDFPENQGESLPPVGQPGNTYSAFGAPTDQYQPGTTPLTEDQGFGALPSSAPQPTPDLQPPPAPTTVGSKYAVSKSSSGYSPDKMNQVQAGPTGKKTVLRGDAAIRAGIQNRYAPYEQAYADNAQQMASAEDEASLAEQAQIEAQARGKTKISDLMIQHHDKMAGLNESAALAKQQAKNDYRAKLLEIPQVNPNALWDDAGAAGQFGIAVSAFVHDFLGAKGIKTSAMDTINQAVRNKIQTQIENINTKKAVAAGFRDLYDMTVQESASQMEVEAKLQGYMLKAVETGIDGEMGKYDSNVARAKHLQAKAGVRQLQIKNLLDVEKHVDDAFNQAVGHQVTREGQWLQASIAKAHDESRAELAAIKAKQGKTAGAPIPDISKSGGDVFKWRFRKEYADDKETVHNVTQKVIATNQAVDGLREIIDLQKQIEQTPTNTETFGRLRDKKVRLETAVRNRITAALILDATGKVANEKEQERILSRVPPNDFFTNGNNIAIISNEIASKKREMDSAIKVYLQDIKPDDEYYGQKASQVGFAEGEGVEAGINQQPEAPPSVREQQEGRATGAGANKRYIPNSPNYDEKLRKEAEFKQFTQPYWADFASKRPDIAKESQAKIPGMGSLRPSDVEPLEKVVPEGFDGVRELAELAHDGDSKARKQLETIAKSQDIDSRAFAQYFLEKLDTAVGPLGISGGDEVAPNEGPVTQPSQIGPAPATTTYGD